MPNSTQFALGFGTAVQNVKALSDAGIPISRVVSYLEAQSDALNGKRKKRADAGKPRIISRPARRRRTSGNPLE